MTPDSSTLEAELRDMHAAALDDAFLSRLEAAAEGTLTELNSEEIRFEAFLRQTSPAAIAPDFLAKLENVVSDVAFPVNEKIVLFPKKNHAQKSQKKQRSMWAAAAAVAFIGGATALMIPAKNQLNGNVAKAPAPISQTSPKLTPASFNRDLGEVSEEGIIWKANNSPHRLMRVVCKDQVTLKDAHGRTYQVEQPRVEYMLVPAETD
jgi:hypothetical protein